MYFNELLDVTILDSERPEIKEAREYVDQSEGKGAGAWRNKEVRLSTSLIEKILLYCFPEFSQP